MSGWTLACFMIAVLAALLGFPGAAGAGESAAKIVSAIFAALFLVLLVSDLKRKEQRRGAS